MLQLLLPALFLFHSGETPEPAPPGEGAASSRAPSLALPPQDDIWSRLSLYADGRVRAEGTFDQLNGEDRLRGRLRFRVGGEYRIDETIRAGARLTTLSDGRDANNPHWDFGDGADGFSAAEVGLDRLYLAWKAVPELELTGGKFGHTFTRPPVTREFAWDDDVQPAGAALTWIPDNGESAFSYDLRAITVVATEINVDDESGSDPAVHGLQVNVAFEASESTDLRFATSYSNWTNLNHFAEFPSAGNTADAGDFDIWDTYVALDWVPGEEAEGGAPLTVFGQYLENLDDDSGEDTGFVAGLQYGRSGSEGVWNVFAASYSLDANAIFAPVAQDDTPIQGSGVGEGMDGLVLGGQYWVTDNLAIKLWGLTSDADADDDPYRIRLDFDFRIR